MPSSVNAMAAGSRPIPNAMTTIDDKEDEDRDGPPQSAEMEAMNAAIGRRATEDPRGWR